MLLYFIITISPTGLVFLLFRNINQDLIGALLMLTIYGTIYYMFKWRKNVRNIGRRYKSYLRQLEKEHFTDYNVSQRPEFYCVETNEKLRLKIRFPNRTSEMVKEEFILDFRDINNFEIEYKNIDPRRTYVTFNKVTG